MSFPISRADLQNPASPKLDLSSVVLPENTPFVDKRILVLSKQVTEAAKQGKKNITLTIIVQKNVEPVSAGLRVNFPDATITVNPENKPVGPKMYTPLLVDWV
jgi:hypothetical protein